MAVVSVSEHWSGRGGDGLKLKELHENRQWIIKTDTAMTRLELLADALVIANLPTVYLTPHPGNSFYTARNLRFSPESSTPLFWRAVAEYSTEPLDKKEEQEAETTNPLYRPADINWDSGFAQKEKQKDIDGKPFITTAGEPYPPKMMEIPIWIISWSKNVASIPNWVADANGSTNETDYEIGGLTIEAGQGRLSGLKIPSRQVENEVEFYALSGQIHWDSDGDDPWELELLNAGLQRKGDSGKPVDIILENGTRPSKPVMLDAAGQPVPNQNDPAQAVFNLFRRNRQIDFNDLPLTYSERNP